MPDGERVYAIGDVHGRSDLLDMLLSTIDADDAARGAARTTLVFLGDLVDRGPDSAGVVDRLLRLSRSRANVRFLLGNHEEVFLRAVRGDRKALRFLLKFGGRETVLSYGVSEDQYRDSDFDELAAMIATKVPEEHVAFLSGFEDIIEIGDYAFVHAGVRPGVPLAEQSVSDLRWIRGDFLDCRESLGKMVVHGHTISNDADICANRIGIDTGAYLTGRLTAIGLEGTDRWFLTT